MIKKHMVSKNIPLDTKLYQQVKREAKQKFLVWPSAYASGWLVKTYKARGGKYRINDSKNESKPLKRWYTQKWVNVCAYVDKGVIESCGRSKAQWKNYPYCRPEKRVSPETPMTLGELVEKYGKTELKRRCKKKRQSPQKRVE
jgi:hypothetical protein